MKVREMPNSIYMDCPDCGDETEHEILKGKMGKASITGTFRCTQCSRVSSQTVKIPALIEVPVVLSDGDVSETIKSTIESNDIVAEEDEFFLDDGRRACVTHIDTIDGKLCKSTIATNVKKIWAIQFDILNIKVSINDGGHTYSMRVEAEPDTEFVVGTQLEFEDFDCLIHAIKTKHSLVKKGAAEARDITRIYGKYRKKRYSVLEFEDDDDEDFEDFDFDDDDE